MIRSAQAYWLAHLPHTIGIHFIGLDMLSDLRAQASPPMLERVSPIVEGWAANGPNVVADVRRLQAMQSELGLKPPPPPRSTEDYLLWRETMASDVNALFADSEERAAEERLQLMKTQWASVLGHAVGEAVYVLNLGGMLHYLLDAEPDNPYLRARLQELGDEQAALGKRLPTIIERAEFVRAFSATGLARAKQVSEVFALAPRVGSAAPKLAIPLQDTMRAVAETELASVLAD